MKEVSIVGQDLANPSCNFLSFYGRNGRLEFAGTTMTPEPFRTCVHRVCCAHSPPKSDHNNVVSSRELLEGFYE